MNTQRFASLLPLASLLCSLLLLPGRASGQPVKGPPTAEQLAALLEPIRKKHDVPALAAAIVDRKGVVAVAAVGVRKRGEETPVTVNDPFHLGSDTKAMTATLAALCVEKGDLHWEDSLAKVFPDLAETMSPQVRKITLQQLLTHHAGLRPNLGLKLLLIPGKLSPREQRQEVLKAIVSEKLDAEPGAKFQYSNLGYILVGHMIEKVANADWEEEIARKLFEPLGMKTAGFGPMGTPGKVDQPWQHRADGTPIEPGPNKDNHVTMGPAGRIHCSLPDWAQFIALHLRAGKGQPAFLKPETFRLLHDSPFTDKAYCLGGWGRTVRNKDAGGLVLAHDGSNTQNYCTAWLAPERGFAVLVATNQGGDPGKEACGAARKELVSRFLPGR